MSPVGPQPRRRRLGVPAYIVWRALIVLALLIAAVAIALTAILYNRETQNSADNTATICSIGGFLAGAPIQRPPNTSTHAFRRELVQARGFLTRVKGLDCPGSNFGRVSTTRVNRQLRAIESELHKLPRRQTSPPPSRSRPRRTSRGQAAAPTQSGASAAPQQREQGTAPPAGAATTSPPSSAPTPSGGSSSGGGGSGNEGGGSGQAPAPSPQPQPSPPSPAPPPSQPPPQCVVNALGVCIQNPLG